MDEEGRVFSGFRLPTTTPVPDELFDTLLPILGHAELKVLLYIIRRTYGFKKPQDPISYSQFLNGITTKDGKVLDRGCGLKSATNLRKALDGLVAKGIILATKGKTAAGDDATTVYALHFSEGVLTQHQDPPDSASGRVMTLRQTQQTVNNQTVNKRRIHTNDDYERSYRTWSANMEPEDE